MDQCHKHSGRQHVPFSLKRDPLVADDPSKGRETLPRCNHGYELQTRDEIPGHETTVQTMESFI